VRGYYVTMIRGPRVAWLFGPSTTETEARGHVERVRKVASSIDPWSDFDLFGVASRPYNADQRGTLNDHVN